MESRIRDMGITYLLDALFPRFCLRCRREGEVWCQVCEESWVMRAPVRACPFCLKENDGRTCRACHADRYLDGVSAMGSYGDPIVREALTTWKYYGDEAYARVIEKWIRREIGKTGVGRFSGTVSFVPLHMGRRRARGFDQAERIAQAVARELGCDMRGLLVRTKRTESQARVGHSERHVGEMDGVFEVVGEVSERVLLCDDVFTSGTTMDAAARALKEVGAKEVWGFVVAKG